MSYITCDGKTYSRYNNSDYVKNCIKEQRIEQEKWCEVNDCEPTLFLSLFFAIFILYFVFPLGLFWWLKTSTDKALKE